MRITRALSANGRVTLPKPMLDKLGWTTGTEVVITADKQGETPTLTLCRSNTVCFLCNRLVDETNSITYMGKPICNDCIQYLTGLTIAISSLEEGETPNAN